MNDSRALTNSDHPVLQIRDLVVEKGGQNVCHVPALSVLQGERLHHRTKRQWQDHSAEGPVGL